MQDGRKAVWSIPYVSVEFFPSLKQNFIAYSYSSRRDCIFEIYQLWQSGFSRLYSNCCSSCSFEPEIIKIGQSSHKMYSKKIQNFQESTSILSVFQKCLKIYWIHHITQNTMRLKIICVWLSEWFWFVHIPFRRIVNLQFLQNCKWIILSTQSCLQLFLHLFPAFSCHGINRFISILI